MKRVIELKVTIFQVVRLPLRYYEGSNQTIEIRALIGCNLSQDTLLATKCMRASKFGYSGIQQALLHTACNDSKPRFNNNNKQAKYAGSWYHGHGASSGGRTDSCGGGLEAAPSPLQPPCSLHGSRCCTQYISPLQTRTIHLRDRSRTRMDSIHKGGLHARSRPYVCLIAVSYFQRFCILHLAGIRLPTLFFTYSLLPSPSVAVDLWQIFVSPRDHPNRTPIRFLSAFVVPAAALFLCEILHNSPYIPLQAVPSPLRFLSCLFRDFT